MKKCPYCGKEYQDDVERCLTDNEVLLGDEPPPSSDVNELTAQASTLFVAAEAVAPPPTAPLTAPQLRIFEIVLVCVIAFGGGILSSGHSLFLSSLGYSRTAQSSSSGEYGWIYSCLREASALGLLWYVLQWRGKSFVDLGLTWARTDIGWAIILRLGGSLAFYAVYGAIYYSGLTTTTHKTASAYVGHVLFGGGIFFSTILFQLLNPFFEELIVRAYVMTEVKQLTNSATKAIIVSTVLQTSYHFYQGAPVAFAHGATFLIWSIYYAKTNRIAPIILAHLYSDLSGTLWYLFRQ